MITENQSQKIRHPAVAYMFYPGKPADLLNSVRKYLSDADAEQSTVKFKNDENSVRALIVPHAGYIYSGKIAASAYQLLQQ